MHSLAKVALQRGAQEVYQKTSTIDQKRRADWLMATFPRA